MLDHTNSDETVTTQVNAHWHEAVASSLLLLQDNGDTAPSDILPFTPRLTPLILNTVSYVPITGCVLEHILTTKVLSSHEKLFYLLADSLALISKNYGNERSTALPAEDWGSKLNCSRTKIFAMQKSLKKKGYFSIKKQLNRFGQNDRNLIATTLPDEVFSELQNNSAIKLGEFYSYDPKIEDKRAYLDKTRLFIRLNYQLLLAILGSAELNSLHKVILLDFFMIGTKCQDYSFNVSYSKLAKRYSCSEKHLAKALKFLANGRYIEKHRFFTKGEESSIEARQDKSFWQIILLLPSKLIEFCKELKEKVRSLLANKSSQDEEQAVTEAVEAVNAAKVATEKVEEAAAVTEEVNTATVIAKVATEKFVKSDAQFSTCDPLFAKSELPLIKYFNINILNSRSARARASFSTTQEKSNFNEICFKDEKDRALENTLPLTESSKTTPLRFQDTEKSFVLNPLCFSDFYPLSEKHCLALNSSANRSFSSLVINEILLSLSKKLSDRLFTSKKAFFSYMGKILRYEMRQEPQVNNTGFRIKANKTQEEIDMQDKEKYLTKIEYSLHTSPEWHLKKKIAAVFERDKAYAILHALKYDNAITKTEGVLKLHFAKYLELTEWDKQILSDSLSATHSRLDLTAEDLGFHTVEIIMPDKNSSYKGFFASKDNGNLNTRININAKDNIAYTNNSASTHNNMLNNNIVNNNNDTQDEEFFSLPDGIWGTVRQTLLDNFLNLCIKAKFMDQNWLSKLEVTVDEESKVISATAPRQLVYDVVTSYYGNKITQACSNHQYKFTGVIKAF